jgi:hypothetical protein
MLIISPARALKSELLPTFGLPIIATTGNAILLPIKIVFATGQDYSRKEVKRQRGKEVRK